MKVLSNLRAQKGLTGIDIVISMSIIVMTVVVITMIYVNIDLNSKAINRAAGGTRLATTIIEQIDKMYYYQLNEEIRTLRGWANDSTVKGIEYDTGTLTYTIVGKEITNKIFNINIPNGYIVEIKLSNSYGGVTESRFQLDFTKEIDITVSYMVGNNLKSIELSTVKDREIVEECNLPSLDNDVIKKNSLENYQIIPIRFSNLKNNFIETTTNNPEWYNYSSGEWARILAIPSSKNKNEYIDQYGEVIKNSDFKEYEYVWIPNFAFRDNFGTDIYFRYGVGKHRIAYVDKLTYPDGTTKDIYMNVISEVSSDLKGINFDGITGRWIRSLTTDVEEKKYFDGLNDSQYKLRVH